MSHRFVRCPHCKMPHDAAERVCPNTGLRLPTENRSQTRDGGRAARGSASPMIDAPATAAPAPKPAPPAGGGGGDASPNSAMTTQHHLLGQTVGGRYRIRGVLGEGGMGTVYDAEHLGLSRQVAIKVLSPTQAKKRVAVKRFQQEARAAGAIGHPNICEVYDLGLLDDGSPYLVMEKLVGQTLAERIGREGGLPFDEVVEVVAQVLSGLTAAHEKGIVHRDIKPENIFLARRLGCPPIIKLLDFGVSKMMPEFQTSEDHLDLTRTGMVMGTPYYMSPEQARGERNLDGRVDVYACGVVMYEALAGKRPFLAPNYNALLLAIINTMPKPLRELRPKTPPELEAIIMRAMAKNRNDRYPSAKHFLHDLMPGATTGANPALPRAEGSGARLPVPAPPTPEERMRAQVLGGGRFVPSAAPSGPPSSPPYREPVADGPSMTLQSRMQAGAGGALNNNAPLDGANATRVERRPKLLPAVDLLADDVEPPSRAHSRQPPSQRAALTPTVSRGSKNRTPVHVPPPQNPVENTIDDIDIPIHVAGEDEPIVDFEDPTEVFRPGMALPPPKGQSKRRSSQQKNPSARQVAAAAPIIDDWDGETVVKRPDMDAPLPSQQKPQASRQSRAGNPQRAPKPFNPDETLRLDTTGDHELERHRRRR